MRFYLLLYNTSLLLYYWIIYLLSPFHTKAKKWIDGRKKIMPIIPKSNFRIWMHCASLGEFEQGRPILERLRREHSDIEIILTFFSPSGYEIHKKTSWINHVCYLPIDNKKNSTAFIQKVQPDLVLFVKYEFWYHYLYQLHIQQIPTLLISGIFRPNQWFFWSITKPFALKTLSCFSHIFVQSKVSLKLLHSMDIHQASLSHDTRFDRVYTILNHKKKMKKIVHFCAHKKTIVLGSTWARDIDIWAPIINQSSDYKFIIAPHHIEKKDITYIYTKISVSIERYSRLSINKNKKSVPRVLIIDNIGMLSSIYQYAFIAYIGGGFGKSTHNILEAAVYGIPVIYGPRHTKMKEAVDLVKSKGGFCIQNTEHLKNTLHLLNTNHEVYTKAALYNSNYVRQQTGGTEKIYLFVKKTYFSV